jgi:hypothetical protein
MSQVPLTRRRFVERLGLGAGAPLLAPIAQTLFAEAQGWAQTQQRKRAVFFLIGDSLHYKYNFAPPEFAADLAAPVMNAPTGYTWPESFKSLEPLRGRTMLVDGLANQVKKSQHSAGYAALSCVTALNDASNEYGGPPGGITIDQYVANAIGATTKVKSALLGLNKYNATTKSFASGAGRPEPMFIDPRLMWTRLFGELGAAGGANPMDAAVNKGAVRNRLLLDSMRADIARMQKQLAGAEKKKLDHYLAAIAEFENRLKVLAPSSCKQPAAPGPEITDKSDKDVKLDLMFDMATLALACGMTNVVGVAAGTGMSHQFMIWPSVGHEGEAGGQRAIATHNAMLARVARLVKTLEGVREGDRTVFDNSVIVYTSDNGEDHHSSKIRWPLVVVGNAGGKLRSDGRFVRYPAKGKPGWRSLADFYCTIAHAVGAPTDKFGDGGVEAVKGPLAEIMA